MKIFLLVMFISIPNELSVKHKAFIYPTEQQCIVARDGYMESYENKDLEYKSHLKTEAFCLPFDSFPIEGLPLPTGV